MTLSVLHFLQQLLAAVLDCVNDDIQRLLFRRLERIADKTPSRHSRSAAAIAHPDARPAAAIAPLLIGALKRGGVLILGHDAAPNRLVRANLATAALESVLDKSCVIRAFGIGAGFAGANGDVNADHAISTAAVDFGGGDNGGAFHPAGFDRRGITDLLAHGIGARAQRPYENAIAELFAELVEFALGFGNAADVDFDFCHIM
jgi:hypothetical protein